MSAMEDLVARWCGSGPVTSAVPGVLTVELFPGRTYDVSVREIGDGEAALESRWTASADIADDAALLREMAEGASLLATGFVRCEATDIGVVISAPLYLEDLGRQAFLTAVAQVARVQWTLDTSAPALEARQAVQRLLEEPDLALEGTELPRVEAEARAVVAKTAAPALAPTAVPAAAPASGPAWSPTHVAPPGGIPAWAAPDRTKTPSLRIEAGVELVVGEERDGWAHVAAWNGWTAWVDAQLLVRR